MKKTFLTVVVIALALFLILPTKTYALWPFDVFLKSSSAGNQTKFPTVIQKIIDKFKLNSGEVQQVINETQTEKQQEMKTRREAKLEEAVKAGVITAEQKKSLLDKEAEWQQQLTKQMQERQQWMKQSGIDFEKLAPYGGFGGPGMGGRGFGKGHGFGGW